MPSLAEQAEARGRQEVKETRMTMELKAAISDRDSLKTRHQVLGEEMEKVKAELAVTQSKWVLYGVQSLLYTVYFGAAIQTGIVSHFHIYSTT